MLVNPSVAEILGTLPPAEEAEILILIGRAGTPDAWRPGEQGRVP